MILHLCINNIFKVEAVHVPAASIPQDAPNTMSIPIEIMMPKD